MDSCIEGLQVRQQDNSSGVEAPTRFYFSPRKVAFVSYRYVLGPALHAIGGAGFGCRYSPTCSHYAEEAFTEHSPMKALYLSARRILRCNPWISAPYFDPVPAGKTSKK